MKKQSLIGAWNVLIMPDLGPNCERLPVTDQDYRYAAKVLSRLTLCQKCGKQVEKSVHHCKRRG